jgi:hypothetical protein
MKSIYKQKIEKRATDLQKWLDENGKNCTNDQAHTLPNTTEKIYWHYGYMIALKDMLKLIEKEVYELN